MKRRRKGTAARFAAASIAILATALVSTACAEAQLLHADAKAGAYYRDADGDGFGSGDPRTTSPGPGWVTNGLDCDDVNPKVYVEKQTMVLDCDGDALADSVVPESVCVARGEIFYWHDADGTKQATFRFPDARSFWWIEATSARHTTANTLIADPDPGCAQPK